MKRPERPCLDRCAGREQGIAILTAMLVIALGTITVVAITSRQQLTMQRERNEAAIQIARNLAVSGERFAAALLYRDRQDALRENSDSLDDDWAQTIPPVPIDEGAAIQGCIVDMQGRFNLNNLVGPEGEVSPVAFEQLQSLLTQLGIDAVKAQAIADWVDADVNATVPEGAEDDWYTGLDPPYRAGNRPFVSASELQLVKGFSPSVEEEREDYERLLPHIATLPLVDGRATPINVNTATPEVLASLSGEIAPLAADLSRWDTLAYEDYPDCEDLFDLTQDEGPETLEGERDTTPYESTLQFDAEVDSADSGEESAPEGSYDVKSNYFQVRIDVLTEAVRLTQYTLFERDNEGRTRVLYRSRDTL